MVSPDAPRDARIETRIEKERTNLQTYLTGLRLQLEVIGSQRASLLLVY
jgi:hypothetical protein